MLIDTSVLAWHPSDETVAEQAGVLGRRWLPSQNLDGADLAVAATAILRGSPLIAESGG